MERVALTAEMRTPGKGGARQARMAEKVPAVLYGRTVEPLAVVVDRKELEKAVKTKAGMNVMVDLTIAGGDSGLALIRDYQADPFKRRFIHIDFQAITLSDKLEVEVPIVFTGASVGVKEGGVVEQLRRTVHVRALPTAIPESIEVDITELNIGDSIHAEQLTLPEGVEFSSATNYTIVAIVPPAKEEVAAVAVPLEGEAAAAPAEGAAAGAAPAEGEAKPAEAKPAEGKKEQKA
ncbi:MAG TPA: 50S ribosomal protein L25 [bacterium]|nr:50S ribosomal protein L25 [bacterium]